MKINKIFDTILTDFSSLGSLAIYLIVTIFAFLYDVSFGLKLALGLIIILGLIILIRILYFKERPKKQEHDSFLEKIDASSFPSIHSARIAFLGTIISLAINKIYVYLLLTAIVVIVCYSRHHLKKHHGIDIIVGALIGIILGFLINFINISY